MGLRLTVEKEDNALYCRFVDAYWKIEDILFPTVDGESYVEFTLGTYPDREASKKTLVPIEQTGNIHVGGCGKLAYEPRIRVWNVTVRAAEIFPQYIPISEAVQKDSIYQWVKSYTGLPFEDVLESDN